MTKKLKAVTLLLSTVLIACLSACSEFALLSIVDSNKTKIRSIHVETLANANRDSAVQMDVLFLMDENLADRLPETAAEWFDQRNLYITSNSEELLVESVELPPLRHHKLKLPRGYKKSVDVIAYTNYLSATGQKWLRLPNKKFVAITHDSVDWHVN